MRATPNLDAIVASTYISRSDLECHMAVGGASRERWANRP